MVLCLVLGFKVIFIMAGLSGFAVKIIKGGRIFAEKRSGFISCRFFAASSSLNDKRSYKLVIVGGGTGGCSIASKFASKLGKDKVAVIEPNERHYYQPLWTLVGGGLKDFDESYRPMEKVLPQDCDWIKDKAKSFDPEHNTVFTEEGHEVKYDFLVVAMGLQLNYNAVKGCLDAIENDPSVVSIYSPKYLKKVQPALKNLKEGNAIFTFPNTPVKCAGAAQKILYLSEEAARDSGKRDKCTFIYNTSLPVIFHVPHYAAPLNKLASSRNITVNTSRNLVEVRHQSKEAIFQILDSKDGQTETFKYSLLHVTPPMSTPKELWNSPLVDQTNYVTVDKDTLQHTKYKNIFAFGDCANTPTSKTAAAIASQLGTVAVNLSLVMDGKDTNRKYNGYTSCPFVVSKNTVLLAEFGYNGQILETFPFDQRVPRRTMFFLKSHVMPSIYWNLMLKGHWHGPSFFRKLWRFGL